MESDRVRWDERYAGWNEADPGPPEALADRPELLALVPRRGRALDVACGAGAQTVWLAARGLDVLAVDVSSRAIELTTASARRHGVADRVEARVHDLDDGLPADGVDVDLLVCQRFRDPRRYRSMADAVRPGGLLVVTVLSLVGHDADDPGPYRAAPGELRNAFGRSDLELLHHAEGDGLATLVARRLR